MRKTFAYIAAILVAGGNVATLTGCGRGYVPIEDLVKMPPVAPTAHPLSSPSPTVVADSIRGVTLDDALRRVMRGNPDLLAARNRLAAADARRVQAHAWDNPSVFAEVEGIDRFAIDDAEVTLGVGMPIDVFAKRGIRVDAAQADVHAAQARYNRVQLDLASRTRMTFHNVLASQERLRVAESRVRLTAATAEALGQQVDAGKAPLIEKLRADVADETARSMALTARSVLRTASRELAALWGERTFKSIRVSGALRTDMPEINADSLGAELRARHPLIQEKLWVAERERHEERRVSRERWPDLIPRAGIRWLRESDEQDFVAGLAVTLPVFDRKGGSLRAARDAREAAVNDVRNAQLQLGTDLDVAVQELKEAHVRLTTIAAKATPLAEEALDLARAGYDGGKFGFLVLLDAQATLITVESARTEALIAFDRALARIEGLLGRSLE